MERTHVNTCEILSTVRILVGPVTVSPRGSPISARSDTLSPYAAVCTPILNVCRQFQRNRHTRSRFASYYGRPEADVSRIPARISSVVEAPRRPTTSNVDMPFQRYQAEVSPREYLQKCDSRA